MTRRFKVFVALNLAGFIGLAAWLRSDISPPDPGDLVLAEEIVPEEDNALPDYLRLERHLRQLDDRDSSDLDPEGWDLLKIALSKPSCQKMKPHDHADWGLNDSFLIKRVSSALSEKLESSMSNAEWPDWIKNEDKLVTFTLHMEQLMPPPMPYHYALHPRVYLALSHNRALDHGAPPPHVLDHMSRSINRLEPFAVINKRLYWHTLIQWATIVEEWDESKAFFQPNRTLLLMHTHLREQMILDEKPNNSPECSPLRRRIRTKKNAGLNFESIISFLNPNYKGEELSNQFAYNLDFSSGGKRYAFSFQMQSSPRVAVLRFKNQHGMNPARLEDLVPEFLSDAPIDVWEMQPMDYDAAKGTFVLRKQTGNGGRGRNFAAHDPDAIPEHGLGQENGSTVLQNPTPGP